MKDQEDLAAVETRRFALVDEKKIQSHRRIELDAAIQASAENNRKQEKAAREEKQASLERKSFLEAKVVEVSNNKDLLGALLIQTEAGEDAWRKKMADVKEEKRVKSKMHGGISIQAGPGEGWGGCRDSCAAPPLSIRRSLDRQSAPRR